MCKTSERSIRVAIIGAGPAGLLLAQTLTTQLDNSSCRIDLQVFERQAAVGGQWNLTPSNAADTFVDAESCGSQHSSMYENMYTNTPKECQELPHYSFKNHFGEVVMPSYIRRKQMKGYIMAAADAEKMKRYVKLNTEVKQVEERDDGSFQISFTKDGKDAVSVVDKVVVAAGHYWKPNVPFFPGLRNFKGQVLHSHDFRSGRYFEGKHVLCIGSHYSGEDIALTCHKFGARKVTLTFHKNHSGNVWPSGVSEKANLKKIEDDGKTLVFEDGRKADDINVIILCTGYLHYYPFMPKHLRLTEPNSFYPQNLYHGIVWVQNPSVFYIGAQDQAFSFPMFAAQAKVIRCLLFPNEYVPIKLPSEENMKIDISKWVQKMDKIASGDDAIDYQAAYILHLSKLSEEAEDHARTSKLLLGQAELFKFFMKHKAENIRKTRTFQYSSIVSGQQGKSSNPDEWAQDLAAESADFQ